MRAHSGLIPGLVSGVIAGPGAIPGLTSEPGPGLIAGPGVIAGSGAIPGLVVSGVIAGPGAIPGLISGTVPLIDDPVPYDPGPPVPLVCARAGTVIRMKKDPVIAAMGTVYFFIFDLLLPFKMSSFIYFPRCTARIP